MIPRPFKTKVIIHFLRSNPRRLQRTHRPLCRMGPQWTLELATLQSIWKPLLKPMETRPSRSKATPLPVVQFDFGMKTLHVAEVIKSK